MKNSVKLKAMLRIAGIIAIVAVIGFSMAACNPDPEPAHKHQWEWTVTTPATCIAKGTESGVCKLDPSHTTTREIAIDPTAHDWGDWTGTVTCTEARTGTRVCSRSETHIETDNNLQPLGHNYQNWQTTTPSTCTTAGEETGTCTRDQVTTTRAGAAALGHDYQNWTTTTAPTCTTAGEETGTCIRDQVTTTRPKAIDPSAHNWGNWTTTAPTCTTTGIDTRTCSLDATHKETRNETAVNPNAHDYQWVTITTPSFIEEGEETEICSHNSSHTRGTRTADPLPITSAAQLNSACTMLNGKTGNYTLNIGSSFNVGSSLYGGIYLGETSTGSLMVTLKGNGTLYASSYISNLIVVRDNQTVIIDSENLTLQGYSNNIRPLVHIDGSAAKLELRNGTISGNTNTSTYAAEQGGGVFVSEGSFLMTGGTISNNRSYPSGSNTIAYGGGVSVSGGSFTMTGGAISNNRSGPNGQIAIGGGVYVYNNGTFILAGGTISGNTAQGSSSLQSNGGGVYVGDNGTFHIVNGTIYGSNETDTSLRNIVIARWPLGAALSSNGTAEHGTINGNGDWISKGTLSESDNTINVVDGELVE